MTSVTRMDASEAVTEPDGRLRAVSHAIVSHRLQEVEGWTVVDQSAILGSHEQALSDVEVGAGPIDKCSAGLRVCAGQLRGVEDQSAHARLRKRCEVLQRMPIDVGCRDLMLVCFYAQITQGQPVVLRIERVAVIDLYAVTLAEEEAIIGKYA